MRIRSLEVEPYRDGRRVRLTVRLSPITQPPNLDIEVLDERGDPVVTSSVIETRMDELDITLHLRDPQPSGEYTAQVKLALGEGEALHRAAKIFRMPPPGREG